MSVDVRFRYMKPLAKRKNIGRHCNVRAGWSKIMDTLRDELRRAGATDVILEAGYPDNTFRPDGWPYSNAKPLHPDVRLSFKKNGKTPLAFECGGWDRFDLNVYMIALTLNSLRAVDRYGCTQGDQQYRGWAQLPPAQPIAAAEWPHVEGAMRFLASVAGAGAWTLADLLVVYRAAAKKAHPDAGGTQDLMAKVNRAKEYIDANLGGAR